MLKWILRISEKGSNSPRASRGLMVLKLFLGMEWMLILGGDLGLYLYLVLLVSFRLCGLENRKTSDDYPFLRFLSPSKAEIP